MENVDVGKAMIRLHPIPDAEHDCPVCRVRLDVRGWLIPGMRNLADLVCRKCGREYYGDLPTGQALYTPQLLDKATGHVYDEYRNAWFAAWLKESYSQRSAAPLPFKVEEFKPLRRPLLLNCLDRCYGHCLTKLLSAQYYMERTPERDLIALVPRVLRWMVPEGVAAIWTVDLPLNSGNVWSDWLAEEIRRRITPFSACELSVAFQNLHPSLYQIQRFTGVQPFPLEQWSERLVKPVVTYICRPDRLWLPAYREDCRWFHPDAWRCRTAERRHQAYQRRCIVAMGLGLRRVWQDLDYAVVGFGREETFPAWIQDLRVARADEAVEVQWCQRYAASHVVVGIHGSNMLLPTAHAGAVVELMPADRWGNTIQDILLPMTDPLDALYRCRIIPQETRPEGVALLLDLILRRYFSFELTLSPEYCHHRESPFGKKWTDARARLRAFRW